jgi:hypothetical protein
MIEIQDSDLVNPANGLEDDFFRWNIDDAVINSEKFNGQYSVLRHTLVSSPIIHAIYRLRYSVDKPLEGLESQSSEDDGFFLSKKMIKELKPVDPDSLDMNLDDFDDLESEMLKFTSKEEQEGSKVQPIVIDLESTEPLLEDILITVQNSSIRVNNESTFEFNSTIRSSSLLKGQMIGDNFHDEDSLLLSLTNGYLLLIKFHLVDAKIKPYVVQWWKTSSTDKELPGLSDVGREIITHSSGQAAILTSMKGLIRLYYFSQTVKHGVMIDEMQNIVFDGTILNCCVIEPLSNSGTSRAFIFTMVMTSQRRFLIRLFEWWLDESRVTEHTPFLLLADFDLPVLTVPLNDSVLLIMEHSMKIIKINQVLSADHDFLTVTYSGSFPVSYFKPSQPLFGRSVGSEVFMSAEDGTVYFIDLSDNKIIFKEILKVPKISSFILEKVDDTIYDFLFSCELTNGGYYRLDNLDIDNNSEVPKLGAPVDKWENWAPLFDIEVVKKGASEELWLTHGKSLSKLEFGIPVEKQINDSSLRKAENVFHHFVNDEVFFIFSFVDKTLVFKYDQDELIDIHDSGLDLIARTIHVSSLENICLQITEESIVIADFENDKILRKEFENKEIVLADCFENFIAVLTGSPDDSLLRLSVYQVIGEISKIGHTILLAEQPNFVKFLLYDDVLYIILGLDKRLSIYRLNEQELERYTDVEIRIEEAHDLVAADNIIYVSSRYGDYAAFDISTSDGLVLTERFKLKLTNEPINFYLTEGYIILISKLIWKLKIGSQYPLPIIIKELRDRVVYATLILEDTKIALLRDDGFSLASLSIEREPILKTIKLNQIAKKVKYLTHLKVFAIISETNLLFANKYKQLNTKLFSRKAERSLFDSETPLCITEWVLPTESKSYRSLLIGCNTPTGGSLKILQPRLDADDKDAVNVLELFNLKTTGAVLSIQQLTNEILIFSSGFELFTVSYNLESQALADPTPVRSFNSLIMNIDVHGDQVLVSTKDFSLTLLEFHGDHFMEVENDPLVRKITNSLLLEENVAITTDKLNCSIIGVQNQQIRFKANVSFVPKLQRCNFLPTWWYEECKDETLIRFIAYGISGDIQLFTLLDKEQTAEYKRLYRKADVIPNAVTGKGFWEIWDGPWSNTRNINTFDVGKFDMEQISGNLARLITSVSI